MEPVTLVSPDGRHYVTKSPVELNNLTMGQGYKRLSDVNDKKSSKPANTQAPKNNDNENKSEPKDDKPVPAKPDSGHTPATDSK